MKKLLVIFLFFALMLGTSQAVFAHEKVNIDFFYSKSCPRCLIEEAFLDILEEKYGQLEIRRFEISQGKNIKTLKAFYKEYEVPEDRWGLVPVTFIEGKYFLGYGGNETTGKQIEDRIAGLINDENYDEEPVINPWTTEVEIRKTIKLPFIGEIALTGLCPFAMAVVLGGLDGFNACAMVALGFLLSALIASGIRKKVVLIGGTFILVSGLVYFLFISTWLNLFLVLEQTKLITFIVSAVIIIFAIFSLKDYSHNIVCKICETNPEKLGFLAQFEQKLFQKMKSLTQSNRSLVWLLLGVSGVAASINLVELACSFGFPLAFTKALADLGISRASQYFYLLIYILFYMLDDFLIFLAAVFTLRISNVSQKYLKTIKLVSGLVLLALGLVMLFKPELLSFSI